MPQSARSVGHIPRSGYCADPQCRDARACRYVAEWGFIIYL